MAKRKFSWTGSRSGGPAVRVESTPAGLELSWGRSWKWKDRLMEPVDRGSITVDRQWVCGVDTIRRSTIRHVEKQVVQYEDGCRVVAIADLGDNVVLARGVSAAVADGICAALQDHLALAAPRSRAREQTQRAALADGFNAPTPVDADRLLPIIDPLQDPLGEGPAEPRG